LEALHQTLEPAFFDPTLGPVVVYLLWTARCGTAACHRPQGYVRSPSCGFGFTARADGL